MLITGLFARQDIGMFANECYQHGMIRGCTISCPVLQRGECELKDAENKELYQEFLQEQETNLQPITIFRQQKEVK